MAFKFTQTPTFTAKVTVPVPNDKGGYDTNTFDAIFERPKDSERKELSDLKDRDLAVRMLKGWKMTDDETKADVPFSPETLAAALEIAPTPRSIAVAFWETLNGARAKN
jgi:hypothetical protein